MSDKTVKTLLIIAVLAGGAYAAWMLYQNYKSGQTGGGVPQLGTNLNSVAPELVGGSSGPAVAPAVSVPVNVTITDSRSQQSVMPETPNTPMIPGNRQPVNQVNNANPGTPDTMPEDSAKRVPAMKRQAVTAPIKRERDRRKVRGNGERR